MEDMNTARWRVWNLILILIMSMYVVFEQTANCDMIDFATQVERHRRMMIGDSEFFNPWQYRIFSAWMLQVLINICDHLIAGGDKIIPFLILRFLQHVAIFYLVSFYCRELGVRNPWLILSGIFILCLTFANSTYHSDLSFNTYFDIIFYLIAALLVLKNLTAWIIPMMFVASLNRETSGLIPFMMLAPFSMSNFDRQKILKVVSSLTAFGMVFFLVRWYYGYREGVTIHGMIDPIDFFKYNVTFFRLYPLLFGTLGIMPFVVLLNFKKLPLILQHWFWLIVPAWLIIHLFKSLAVETRLFLVPHTLIFLPAFLLIGERWYKDHSTTSPSKNE